MDVAEYKDTVSHTDLVANNTINQLVADTIGVPLGGNYDSTADTARAVSVNAYGNTTTLDDLISLYSAAKRFSSWHRFYKSDDNPALTMQQKAIIIKINITTSDP